jgi:hypothetical protein
MDIADIKERKKEVEQDILSILLKFQSETGVLISSVSFYSMHEQVSTDRGYKEYSVEERVDIKIQL